MYALRIVLVIFLTCLPGSVAQTCGNPSVSVSPPNYSASGTLHTFTFEMGTSGFSSINFEPTECASNFSCTGLGNPSTNCTCTINTADFPFGDNITASVSLICQHNQQHSANATLIYVSVCGNSIVDDGEQCDDGNTNDDDGCSAICEIETGWSCWEMCAGQGLLEESQEVPPNNSSGSGTWSVLLNTLTRLLNYNISFSNFEGNTTAAHIHGPATSAQNAGVQVNLTSALPLGVTAGSFSDSDTLSEAQRDWLFDQLLYINIHSTVHPSGEVRGQLDVSCNPSICRGICGDSLVSGEEECDDGNTENADGCSSQCRMEPCTYSQGAWKNMDKPPLSTDPADVNATHCREGCAKLGTQCDNLNSTGPPGACDELQDSCDKVCNDTGFYYNLSYPQHKDDLCDHLAGQWFAAIMNFFWGGVLHGFDPTGSPIPDELVEALRDFNITLLCVDNCTETEANHDALLNMTELLDDYNTGIIGPGHCEEPPDQCCISCFNDTQCGELDLMITVDDGVCANFSCGRASSVFYNNTALPHVYELWSEPGCQGDVLRYSKHLCHTDPNGKRQENGISWSGDPGECPQTPTPTGPSTTSPVPSTTSPMPSPTPPSRCIAPTSTSTEPVCFEDWCSSVDFGQCGTGICDDFDDCTDDHCANSTDNVCGCVFIWNFTRSGCQKNCSVVDTCNPVPVRKRTVGECMGECNDCVDHTLDICTAQEPCECSHPTMLPACPEDCPWNETMDVICQFFDDKINETICEECDCRVCIRAGGIPNGPLCITPTPPETEPRPSTTSPRASTTSPVPSTTQPPAECCFECFCGDDACQLTPDFRQTLLDGVCSPVTCGSTLSILFDNATNMFLSYLDNNCSTQNISRLSKGANECARWTVDTNGPWWRGLFGSCPTSPPRDCPTLTSMPSTEPSRSRSSMPTTVPPSTTAPEPCCVECYCNATDCRNHSAAFRNMALMPDLCTHFDCLDNGSFVMYDSNVDELRVFRDVNCTDEITIQATGISKDTECWYNPVASGGSGHAMHAFFGMCPVITELPCCPGVQGACCVNETCIDCECDECQREGGVPSGDNCSVVPCTTPTPSTTTPNPSTTTPNPSTTTPNPSTTTPNPSTTTPNPSTTTPNPSTTTPNPSTTTPNPSTTTPNPSTTTPNPSTTTPMEPTPTPPPICDPAPEGCFGPPFSQFSCRFGELVNCTENITECKRCFSEFCPTNCRLEPDCNQNQIKRFCGNSSCFVCDREEERPRCNESIPNECSFCNDTFVDTFWNETCDPPGSFWFGRICGPNCTFCGDGIVDPGEDCDDGNSFEFDTCRNNCTFFECPPLDANILGACCEEGRDCFECQCPWCDGTWYGPNSTCESIGAPCDECETHPPCSNARPFQDGQCMSQAMCEGLNGTVHLGLTAGGCSPFSDDCLCCNNLPPICEERECVNSGGECTARVNCSSNNTWIPDLCNSNGENDMQCGCCIPTGVSTTSPLPSTTSPRASTTSPRPSTTSPRASTTSPIPNATEGQCQDVENACNTQGGDCVEICFPPDTIVSALCDPFETCVCCVPGMRMNITLPSPAPPMPSTTTPNPSTTTPNPSTTTPNPSTTTPNPSTTTPNPSTTTPNPSTTTPLEPTPTPVEEMFCVQCYDGEACDTSLHNLSITNASCDEFICNTSNSVGFIFSGLMGLYSDTECSSLINALGVPDLCQSDDPGFSWTWSNGVCPPTVTPTPVLTPTPPLTPTPVLTPTPPLTPTPAPVPTPPQAVCGNGILQPPEQCDDGNLNNGDGCTSNCTIETSTCCWFIWESNSDCSGNVSFVLPTGGGCVNTNISGTGFNSVICNGALANAINQEGCTLGGDVLPVNESTCTSQDDNSAVVLFGNCYEAPIMTPTPPLTPTPPSVICGNGQVEGDEECDDNNLSGGDGCSATCTIETSDCCWFIFEGSTDCMSGVDLVLPLNVSTCVATGVSMTGFNSVICVGNTTASYNSVDCTTGPIAGDPTCANNNPDANSGFVRIGNCYVAPVPLDNVHDHDGVPPNTNSLCGNEQIDLGESCDDGNTNSGDGCSSTCQTERCFVCSSEPSRCIRVCQACCLANGDCVDGSAFSCSTRGGEPQGSGSRCSDSITCTQTDTDDSETFNVVQQPHENNEVDEQTDFPIEDPDFNTGEEAGIIIAIIVGLFCLMCILCLILLAISRSRMKEETMPTNMKSNPSAQLDRLDTQDLLLNVNRSAKWE